MTDELWAQTLDRIGPKAAVKHDKPRMSLLPWSALVSVAQVLTFGAKKYADDSWKAPPFKQADYFDAMARHMARINDGEPTDPESGLPHAAHVACNALMFLWYELQKSGGAKV